MRRFICLLLLGAVACSSAETPDAMPSASVSSGNPGDDGVGPYVSVAVDNHFHDVHPENHITIDRDRTFVIRNEGRNLHNVTIVGTDYAKDVRPGKSLTLAPVGDLLGPGTYQIVCRYHGDVGMTGEITIE